MSVREYPSEDSDVRQRKAEQVEILDVREISPDEFADVSGTVYEIDALNEDGERRENITIIPSILFENTKDVQHRHEYGIVGKYSRALAMHDEDAMAELTDAIRVKRDTVQEQIADLRDKDSRLLHTMADLGDL